MIDTFSSNLIFIQYLWFSTKCCMRLWIYLRIFCAKFKMWKLDQWFWKICKNFVCSFIFSYLEYEPHLLSDLLHRLLVKLPLLQILGLHNAIVLSNPLGGCGFSFDLFWPRARANDSLYLVFYWACVYMR